MIVRKTHTKPSLVLLRHVVYDVTYHDVRVRMCATERERERKRERARRGSERESIARLI